MFFLFILCSIQWCFQIVFSETDELRKEYLDEFLGFFKCKIDNMHNYYQKKQDRINDRSKRRKHLAVDSTPESAKKN